MKYTMIINRYPPLEPFRLQTNNIFYDVFTTPGYHGEFFHVVATTLGEDEPPSDLYIRWRDIESVEQYENEI